VATATGTLTNSLFPDVDAQNARTLVQALQGGDGGDARNARTLVQAIQSGDGGDAQTARIVVQVLQEIRYEARASGVATVTGTLFAFDGASAGVASVTGDLDNIRTESRSGRTAVQVAVTVPTALLDSRSGRTAVQVAVSWVPHNLAGRSDGVATASAQPSISDVDLVGSAHGQATVTGTIANPGPEIFLTPGQDTFIVPDYVYELDLKSWGAGGGGAGSMGFGIGGDGGGGGFTANTIPVTPGETLDVFIGGEGGLGIGGNVFNSPESGGGGGYSGLKRSGAYLNISGGGGGGASDYVASSGLTRGDGGAGGGIVGHFGEDVTDGGKGGTFAAGGLAGTGTGSPQDGSSYQGGGGGHAPGGGLGGANGGGDGGKFNTSPRYSGAGGGGGHFGGGGGADTGGGGGGPGVATGTDITNERGSWRIGAGQFDPDWPGSGYGNGGLGSATIGFHVPGEDGEGGAVWIAWSFTNTAALPAVPINGVASVQGTLDPLHPGTIPVPIPVDLALSATTIHDLEAISAGKAAVAGQLEQIMELVGGSDGVAAITDASLDNAEMELTGRSDGVATILATLSVGSGGVFPNELEGRSDGVAFVYVKPGGVTGETARDQNRTLYQWINVGVAFNETDIYTGPEVLVDQNFPDGNPQADFVRSLMQWINVGVAFDDTDNVDTRTINSVNPYVTTPAVDQNFPDGNIHTDWARHLYQFIHVLENPPPTGRLTIGPAPTRDTFHPPAQAPTSSVRRRAPLQRGPRRTSSGNNATIGLPQPAPGQTSGPY
jgi:hypothetical protein